MRVVGCGLKSSQRRCKFGVCESGLAHLSIAYSSGAGRHDGRGAHSLTRDSAACFSLLQFHTVSPTLLCARSVCGEPVPYTRSTVLVHDLQLALLHGRTAV